MGELREQIKDYDGLTDEDDPDYWDSTVREHIDDYINNLYEEDYSNAEERIKRAGRFDYFKVSIEPGYYEGLSIYIKDDFPFAWDDEAERETAKREAWRLGLLLDELNGLGFHGVWPGWCNKYFDYEQTEKSIAKAVAQIWQDIMETPIYDPEKGIELPF